MLQYAAMTEQLSFTPSNIAVAESMFYTRGIYEAIAKQLKDPLIVNFSLEKKLEDASLGNCEEGSLLALSYLSQNYGDEFDRLLLIKGQAPFKKWYGVHVYFLAHNSSSDTWYAGSPANHEAYETGSPFDTLIASSDLNAVFRGISEKDGGRWPDVDEVLSSLDNYQPPIFRTTDSNSLKAKVFTFDYRLEVLDPNSVNSPEEPKVIHPPFEMIRYSMDSAYLVDLAA